MVVANLLDNAMKYSRSGSEIHCAVGVSGPLAFAKIRDAGLGIAAENMALLFTRFGRLPTDENVTIPGTGLGLFLSREIARRHGGDITVVSTRGSGSEFTLALPALT